MLNKQDINKKSFNILVAKVGLDEAMKVVKTILFGHWSKMPKFTFIEFTEVGYVVTKKTNLVKKKSKHKKRIRAGLISYLKRVQNTMSQEEFEKLCLTKGVNSSKLK